MSAASTEYVVPQSALRLLAAAPHRLMFFTGAANVLLAMGWWTWWLIDTRWQVLQAAQPAVPAGWLHAMLMQYQVLPSFMFGFLLTVFPRWMNLPPLGRRHYVPVGVGLFAGQLLTLAGTVAGPALLEAGAFMTLAGWGFATFTLVRLVLRDRARDWHSVSCAFALSFGLLGLAMYVLFLHGFGPRFMFAAIKIGSFAVLLPIYFTVCHRMIPFFTSMALRRPLPARPTWALLALWLLGISHVW